MTTNHRSAFAASLVACAVVRCVGAQSPMFEPLPGFPSSAPNHEFVLAADFDGDGKSDALRSGNWGVSVVFDIASATPGPVLNMAIPPTVFGSLKSEAAASDLDNDGDLDVVMTVYGSPPAPGGTPPPPNVVRVLQNDGTGALTLAPNDPVAPETPGEIPRAVAAGDLNADGFGDVVVHVYRYPLGLPDLLKVYLGGASGFFLAYTTVSPAPPLTLGSLPRRTVVLGDFDGDGFRDFAWLVDFGFPAVRGDVAIGYGDGAGGFLLSPYSTASVGWDSAIDGVADMDSDGKDDLVCTGLGSVNIIYGTTHGSIGFVNAYLLGAGGTTWSAAVADWDADGVLDVVAYTHHTQTYPINAWVRALRGLGARAFQYPGIDVVAPYYAPTGRHAVAAADGDGDGDPELIAELTNPPPVLPYSGPFTSAFKRFRSRAAYAPGCAGTGGVVPKISVGTASLGNSAFAIGVSDAAPFSLALLGLSTAPAAGGPCGVSVDLGSLLLPLPGPGATWTDANGAASIALPIPNLPFLSGVAVYAQWAVADPAGGLGPPGATFSATPARTVLIL